MLGVLGVDDDARDAADYIDAIRSVGLTLRNKRGPDRLPDRNGRCRRGSEGSRPASPDTGLRAMSGERCRRLDDGRGKGSCRAPGLPQAPVSAGAELPSLHGGPGKSEPRLGSSRNCDGRYNFVVESRIALTEIREQPLERFSPGERRDLPSPRAAVNLCVDLASHAAPPSPCGHPFDVPLSSACQTLPSGGVHLRTFEAARRPGRLEVPDSCRQGVSSCVCSFRQLARAVRAGSLAR